MGHYWEGHKDAASSPRPWLGNGPASPAAGHSWAPAPSTTPALYLVVREGCSLHWMWMVLSSCMLRRRVAGTLELGRCVVFLLRREQQDVVSPWWLDREGLRDEG